MRYQILIYNNAEFETASDGELGDEFGAAHQKILTELKASGELVDSNELDPEGAFVVRAQRGGSHRVTVTDGPFSEAKEWVGGFYTIECATADRATEIAGRFVEARFAPVEVRRLVHEATPTQ